MNDHTGIGVIEMRRIAQFHDAVLGARIRR